MGAETIRLPVLSFHKFFPVRASSAIRYPSSSPAKISPPAVERVPAQGGVYKRKSHLLSPVRGSSALINPHVGSLVAARETLPQYDLPSEKVGSVVKYSSHPSRTGK